VQSAVLSFVAGETRVFNLVILDPPRAGLGLELAGALPARVGRRLIYVSCDPATLARDLAALVAGGLEICGARLYDLFPFTHRVEAVVALESAAAR
jgi:tRNA/tmRNA/rRNA uracil-C5-methylase (TrmA/RlmC/RlmD family)